MGILINTDTEYKNWISELKQRIRQSQIKAAVKVNTELIRMYWELGKDIVEKQAEAKWGSGFFKQLSDDLNNEFKNMQGFSITNLKYMKRFFLFYNQNNKIRHQVGDELTKLLCAIPWRHQIEIFTKVQSIDEALFYIHKTIEQGWSRNVLMHYISIDLYRTEGKSISNFKNTLPSFQSDLAQQTLKDPYNFDFLTMRDGYREREFLPIGISEYELSKLYPKDIKSSLPSIEDIENELKEQL